MHHRKSIRLKEYDYSQAGAYFITICAQNRQCLFGNIADEKMILNDAGKMIEKWYHELENKFPDIACDEYIIMPNHFHAVIIINESVGATRRGRPEPDGRHETNNDIQSKSDSGYGHPRRGAPTGVATDTATIGEMIGWFKTMTTNEYIHGVKNKNWPPFPGKLWQRNYLPHEINEGYYE
jgi:REP-associated tyrosine transposase